MRPRSPILETTRDARRLARRLLSDARFGSLGVIDPETGSPFVTRVSAGSAPDGRPVLLVSELSQHTRALHANPACSLLLGEPGAGGDPLAHPRLTVTGRAEFILREAAEHEAIREGFLETHPEARGYAAFADFRLVRVDVESGFLNAGFGKAYLLGPDDILARG